MPNELRVRQNFMGGLVEDNPLTAAATTLTSAALAAVPVIGTTQHYPIVLDPDGINGDPEIAWITAHTTNAVTATLVRGQEGTTARQHFRDIPWLHGPTTLDITGYSFTTQTSANVTVANNSVTYVTTAPTFTVSRAQTVFAQPFANASSPSIQGAFLGARLYNVTDNRGVAEAEGLQRVESPLNNHPITGASVTALAVPGKTYRWDWILHSGNGNTTCTFSSLSMDIGT